MLGNETNLQNTIFNSNVQTVTVVLCIFYHCTLGEKVVLKWQEFLKRQKHALRIYKTIQQEETSVFPGGITVFSEVWADSYT